MNRQSLTKIIVNTSCIIAIAAVVGVPLVGLFLVWSFTWSYDSTDELVHATPAPVRQALGPPTELILTVSETNGLRLDYTRSDWASSALHFYRFELERASSEDGVYQHHQTIDHFKSPSYFDDELVESYWYRARGQRCITYERVACGIWSDYSVPVKMTPVTPVPTGLRKISPAYRAQ